MNHYRLYHLDEQGRIKHAEWLSADCDDDAGDLARLIQRPGFVYQELWLREQRLAVTVLGEAASAAA